MFPLLNYIGIRGYDANPPSNRFINELPGITMRNMQKVANEEQVTFLGSWQDVQNRGWMRLSTDIRNKLRSVYNLKTNRRLISIFSSVVTDTIEASGHYRGLVVGSGYDFNGFFAFHIRTIKLNSSAETSGVVVKVFDQDGTELDSFTFNAVIGNNIINVNRSYAARELFIAVDSTNIALFESELYMPSLHLYYESVCDLLGHSENIVVYSAEAMKESPSVHAKTGISYGLAVDMMATCDYSSIVSYNLDSFLPAWMYLCGAELMLERQFSNKKNELTTVDAEMAEELRDHYTGEYENALNDAIKGIRIDKCDACIECRDYVTRVERLP